MERKEEEDTHDSVIIMIGCTLLPLAYILFLVGFLGKPARNNMQNNNG